ncbi:MULTISPECIES: glycine cleavage system aminomethyltransferase GcvT [unclassified Halomonas]|uniref:glycine cleavage system aminomethyltransferase GcvT n=1 Tax=unclassified Halomonas TaxID=2609666 RepID=UPI0005FA7DDB|nr:MULTISPECIES: glycine cleavage system aminomethyltransferase GcvT [unclassified Halomonas]MBR9773155.1 glycine cleavage system aminomethyltransferase GcvT [Gammaproteobacteria bacterium]KJZ17322.1 glycine cleavage system protein T [Halomonas sp. S2151]MAR70962.1 glycine cleavage system aminomethyltransferase T [Halomonas sp.]MBR9879170.1 glycine cleavage system aminomethyltransferase GcvT [Gammaproteobacteria bacterium]MBY5941357.1 glycine cleavage system aminomethyltransferase GcvT [Halomo
MSELKTTPLNALHRELGAKMVPFAGYDMPVQYPLGVKKEHEHTRAACGLFDVSHMAQILIRGENALAALETLVPADLVGLPEGMQRYGLFTSEDGGILDDLMTVNAGDHLYLVVNAACRDQDIAHLRRGLPDHEVEVVDRGLLALQGPKTADVMARLCPAACEMVFMQHGRFDIDGIPVWISRSGYTGEDGFEISVPADQTDALARKLLAEEEVEAIGLGARDSLRLEAGLCLYGHDIDTTTTPVEAGLIWAIGKPRRRGGERAGGFPGADLVLHQVEVKDHQRKRVGLLGEGRAPVREGAELYSEDDRLLGQVTSGGFGPSVGKPVAMGYVSLDHAEIGTTVYAEVRGKRLPMTVTRMPVITPGYYRG